MQFFSTYLGYEEACGDGEQSMAGQSPQQRLLAPLGPETPLKVCGVLTESPASPCVHMGASGLRALHNTHVNTKYYHIKNCKDITAYICSCIVTAYISYLYGTKGILCTE